MDNGDSLLDVIDGTSDLFGQHDSQGGLYNWADEFLGDEMDLSSNTVTVESGNLVTNVNQPNLLLTSQNYAITSSVPAQNIAIASSQFHSGKSGGSGLVTQNKTAVINQAVQLNTNQTGMTTQIVQQGNQQFILRTQSGGQIQLSQQQQLQFQQQILQQQQQQQQQNTSFHQILAPQNSASQAGVVMSQSLTPNSMGGLSFSGSAGAITHTVSQMRASPAPNINLVHLPPQQQQHTSQQQQFQLAPGTILQIPTGGGTSQNLVNTTLIQGQHAILGNAQQGTLVNAQNTVIQNPNVVNVNVAAQHVLCGSPAQQPRTSLGLSHSPFNIQGTLIQTAEGKSILIPSQNLAQPINLQGLSVATPIAQPQIQQQTQNTVSNMLHLAQQQQTGSNQGLQQIVLNHQGQQILVQRAPASVGQPQNIILRTASGQSGIVQLQQRAPQAAQVQTAQHTLQALGAGSGQQLHVINQQGSAQQGVPVINIGGQNVTLQQLSSQLGNIQGLQIQQSQQVLQQQPLHQQTQHDQLTFTQGQGQLQQVQTSAGVMTYSQGQLTFTPHSTVVSQPKMSVSQSPLNQSDNSMNSVENQTRLILQQIHNSLKKSQANALSSAAANVSTIQAMHGNAMNVKQEYTNTSCASSLGNVHTNQTSVPQISVKSEPNLIECLIKQESNVVSSNTGAGHSAKSVHGLLTSNAPVTLATTTVSQAATQMSLFVLSNSQNVISSNVSTHTNSFSTPSSVSMGKIQNTTVVPKIENSSVNSAQIGTQNITGSGIGTQSVTGSPQGTATLQTIHLPPELQQKFQQVQQEIRKVQAMTNITAQHRQKLQQLQIFQKQILLKGRVLATTKTDAQQLQQTLTTGTFTQAGLTNSYTSPISSVQSPSSTIAQIKASLQASSEMSVQRVQSPASQFRPAQSNEGLKNLLKQEMHTQPDSTSTLGQDMQNGNSLQNLLGSPGISSTSVSSSHQLGQSSQSLSGYQSSPSVNHSVATPPPNATPLLPSVANSQGSAETTAASTVPQVAVPTQIKIADKVLTLSLTPAQKEKVQSYLDRMTPEQQMQYLQTQQHVLQRIQKQQALNAQIRAQVEAQKKQAALSSQGQTTVSAAGQAKSVDSAPVNTAVLGPELKTIPIPNPGIITQPSDITPTALRGQKRSYMDIPKGTLINQQIRQDQNHAIKPNTKQPFRSRGDACRRLLRYHVFQQYGPSTEDFQRFDGYMEDLSDELLKKKDRMFEKFRQLLVQETLRVQPSSELVMLQRMQNQDLRKTLEEEKLQVKVNPELFVPMPMKYLGKQEPEVDETGLDTVQVKMERSESSDSAYEFKEPAVKVEVKSEIEDDNSEDDENLESRAAKMRKLVIKTDGMNFSSSFKRMSMEGSQSSIDNERDPQEDSDTNDYETNQSSVEIHESKRLSLLDDDDEDTNEYSNKDKFDDEAEQAAMLISSADNSQDSQGDSSLDVYSVDNSQSQMSVQSNAHFYSNTRNFELANEHMYDSDDDDSSKDVNKYVHYSRHSSVNDNKQGIPKKASMVTNSAFDNLLDTADGEDSDIDDKFDMYQPITESLTDSEENSYYSADNALERKTIVIDDDDDDSSRHNWKKSDNHKTGSNSHGEPDPDVEAQMESAINSILSLSQGASTSRQNSIYSYSQSHSFLDSQSESLFSDSHDLQAELDFQTDQSKMSTGVTARANRKSDGDFSTDLDAAVNSILM